MWISKKRWKALIKRIADLEGQVQGQQQITLNPELLSNTIAQAIRDNALRVPKTRGYS